MKKFYLVDVSGFIFRAYHALPPMRRQDGLPVGAVFGFCTMLMRLQDECRRDDSVGLLAAIFDAGRRTFRNDIYPEYKSHRPPPPEDLIPQFPLVREACQALSVVGIEQEGFEADDLIASYAKAGIAAGYTVVVVSSDKDLMQLVRPGITLLDPIKNRSIDVPEVLEKFGVPPEKVIDVQALAGDSSDNVPGVPGVGPKTAAELIKTYGDLETVLARAGEIKQPKRREALLANAELARISKQLVTLRDDVPLLHSLESLYLQNIDPMRLRDFLMQQNFRSLVTRLDNAKPAPSVLGSSPSTGQKVTVPQGPETITTQKALQSWAQRGLQTSVVAISLTKEDISLAFAPGVSCHIPLDTIAQPQLLPSNKLSPQQALLALGPLLRDPAILKVGHNLKDDLRALERYDVAIAPYADTMLMSYVLNAGKHTHGLDELTMRYLNHKAVVGEKADLILKLYELFHKELAKNQVASVYEMIERPLIPVIIAMERAGIAVDQRLLHSLGQEFDQGLSELEKQIWQSAGHDFNIGSPKQLGVVLFDELNLPQPKKTKTGSYTTDADTLEALAAQGFTIAQQVLDWRGLAKLKTTYVDGLLAAINKTTGRIHTSYSMAVAATGRLSSSDPNLQNIPIRTPNGRKIRAAFIAKPGHQLLSLDYSQIELRLLAHVANVDALIDAFRRGQDIHTRTASEIFGLPLDGVDADLRRKAKAINFGIIYGISAYGLGQQLGITNTQAATYIKAYFEHYPGIEAYMEKTKEFARKHGYVTTLFGRRCYTLGVQDTNAVARQFAERQAINATLQGTNADIIKKAMLRSPGLLHQHRLNAKLLLQVHDELVFEVPDAEVATTGSLLQKMMESIAALRVPLSVGVKAGRNWSEVE
ncbi:MAG: DNA polymerase I [Alphaproteobacteria bacterium]